MADSLGSSRLPPEQLTRVHRALLGAFSLPTFRMMLRQRLGVRLDEEVSVEKGFRLVVHDYLELAEESGSLEGLLRAAIAERRGNALLVEVVRSLGIDELPPLPAQDAPDRLQKLVRARAPSINFADYLRQLEQLANQLCRFEVGANNAIGTGWLVAADLVLTNYHVVKAVHERRVAYTDIGCRFDYFTAPSASGEIAGSTVCALADDWLLDSSPFAQHDRNGTGPEPTEQELDYALIRLARPIGADTVLQRPRGWLNVSPNPPAVMAGDISLVVQHAGGRALELAFGAITGYNAASTRFRHDANTEPGSSGAPALTIELQPFGLHHAGGSRTEFQYNQGIPLRRIVASMRKKSSVPMFWNSPAGTA